MLSAEKGRMALKIGMVWLGSTVSGALSNTLPLLRTATCAPASQGPCRSFAKTRRARIPLLPDWQESAWITWAYFSEGRLGSRCLDTAMSSDSDVRSAWFLAEKAHRFSKPLWPPGFRTIHRSTAAIGRFGERRLASSRPPADVRHSGIEPGSTEPGSNSARS